MIPTKKVLDIPVACLSFEEQIMLILRWAKMRASKIICLANVHMLMEAYWNPAFAQVLHKADLVTPDGKPLVWMLHMMGALHQNQVAGMDIFLNLCDLAEQTGIKVYFLGSTKDILEKIKQKLNREYPILQVVGMNTIPFISIEEIVNNNQNQDLIAEINQSGAGIVFVCLGCPKQEIWMSQYQGSIQAVMIGVGAVFSMYAGINPRAPYWIQQVGLEWLYRLLQEPRRLWRRYGATIPPFLYLAAKQLVRSYKEKLSKARWRLTERNVDVETLDFSPEKLGEILIRQNVITREELEQALAEQNIKPNLKIGEILVRSNHISLSQLKFYLKNQTIKLGQLLVERKILKPSNLKNILALEDSSTKKLGEIVSEKYDLSEDQLKEVLIELYIRHKGLWVNDKISNHHDLSLWIQELSLAKTRMPYPTIVSGSQASE